ncbi:hypothetical protein [Aurantiacibacter gangjinensis]|uniref:Uncharacterized protein n=1 Tax=Aurantiacibacter gangjinensis TaxID=502682 RepID=A0A0G9MUS1_9SPHN|nr:hypothetical protein [Aurantiacibacter gangjinensis]KLE33068.1 hypothetical protein AAW01_03470 [Aurantiacibacter gangjinensis]
MTMPNLLARIVVAAAIGSLNVWGEAKAQDAEEWVAQQIEYGCIVRYEDHSQDAMFQYQINSSYEYAFGFRPPDWDPWSEPEEGGATAFQMQFDGDVREIDSVVDPMVGRELVRGEALGIEDFAIFQGFDSLKIIDGNDELVVNLDNVDAVRQPFADCIARLDVMGTPPIPIPNMAIRRDFDLIQRLLLRLDTQEIVVSVDDEGAPTSCRTDPSVEESAEMRELCNSLLQNSEFRPATDANGDPINGEYALFSRH